MTLLGCCKQNRSRSSLHRVCRREELRGRALLTAEGRRRQFALVHAVDGAEGAHDVARAEAVQHLARLDERFAGPAAREFTVCLRQGGQSIAPSTPRPGPKVTMGSLAQQS